MSPTSRKSHSSGRRLLGGRPHFSRLVNDLSDQMTREMALPPGNSPTLGGNAAHTMPELFGVQDLSKYS